MEWKKHQCTWIFIVVFMKQHPQVSPDNNKSIWDFMVFGVLTHQASSCGVEHLASCFKCTNIVEQNQVTQHRRMIPDPLGLRDEGDGCCITRAGTTRPWTCMYANRQQYTVHIDSLTCSSMKHCHSIMRSMCVQRLVPWLWHMAIQLLLCACGPCGPSTCVPRMRASHLGGPPRQEEQTGGQIGGWMSPQSLALAR